MEIKELTATSGMIDADIGRNLTVDCSRLIAVQQKNKNQR